MATIGFSLFFNIVAGVYGGDGFVRLFFYYGSIGGLGKGEVE